MQETPRPTRRRTRQHPYERRMSQRGDRVIPLDERLTDIEQAQQRIDKRIDRITWLVGVLVILHIGLAVPDLVSLIKLLESLT